MRLRGSEEGGEDEETRPECQQEGQTVQGLVKHYENFDFYVDPAGKPMADFEHRSDMTICMF